MRISKGHSILQPLIFRGFVGFRKCNDSTEFKTYSSKWVHMFHPQRSFEQKIRPPKKPLKLVAWHRQSISHTLDPLTLEATDSWRLTLQVWWIQWLLVGGCKLANFQCFEAKDVLNRNLAIAPFIAPYAEGNLDTPSSVSGSLPFQPARKVWRDFRAANDSCSHASSSINIRSKMNPMPV